MRDDLLKLAHAAIEAERLRGERARLLRERNACVCESEATDFDGVTHSDEACWKPDPGGDHGYKVGDEEGFCASCEKRQKAHDAYLALGDASGIAKRRVIHLAKKAADR